MLIPSLINNLLEQVGLTAEKHARKPGRLSGGEQQRVAIARALANRPKLILADEPTGNLDTKKSDEIMRLFQQINSDGATIILITHEPSVAKFAKRIIKLEDGEIVSDEKNKNKKIIWDIILYLKKTSKISSLKHSITYSAKEDHSSIQDITVIPVIII